MAKKITELTSYSSAAASDVIPIVDVTTSATKKITVSDFFASPQTLGNSTNTAELAINQYTVDILTNLAGNGRAQFTSNNTFGSLILNPNSGSIGNLQIYEGAGWFSVTTSSFTHRINSTNILRIDSSGISIDNGTGTLKKVLIGSTGTGPGGVGRALYISS